MPADGVVLVIGGGVVVVVPGVGSVVCGGDSADDFCFSTISLSDAMCRSTSSRFFASGLTRVGSSLLRELIDAELFERGFSAQLAKLEVVGVAKPDLRALVSLEGSRLEASVSDGSGHPLDLTVMLRFHTASRTLTGSIRVA